MFPHLEYAFYVEGKGWVEAKDMQVGDEVRNAEGESGELARVTTEEAAHEMYNLTVDEAHTFCVGDGQWLVHNACKEFDIVPYFTNAPGFEKHHGVMDVWAKINIPRYSRRSAPAIVLTEDMHRLTIDYYNFWRLNETGSITGSIDWTKMSARQAQELSYGMFNYAGVPDDIVQEYFRQFYIYLYR